MLCPYCLNEFTEFARIDDEGEVRYECPEPACRRPISFAMYADYAKYPPIVFSLIGLSGHGKTCYEVGLLYELMSRAGKIAWPKFSLDLPDEVTMAEVDDALRKLRKGELPQPSFMGQTDPVVLRLDGVPRVGRMQLFVYDNGGEVFTDALRLRQNAPYVTRAPVVVWFVSLADLATPSELLQLLVAYREGVLSLGVEPVKQSLVVVLTKADGLPALFGEDSIGEAMSRTLTEPHPPVAGYSEADLVGLSDEIERWMESSADQHNFVRRARATFAEVRYCLASSLGASPNPENRLDNEAAPRGVLLPLFWLAQLQLPKVVVREGSSVRTAFSLEEAVAGAAPGARIELGPGTYELTRPLQIAVPLTLIGAGAEQTIVSCSAERWVVGVRVRGKFSAKGISFVHEGTAWANVVDAAAFEIYLTGCHFRGAASETSATSGLRGGLGLKISAQSRGIVSECLVEQNATSGVQVVDEARVDVRDNVCRDNGSAGVVYQGQAIGRIERNVLRENGQAGIIVSGSASPAILGNSCEANGRYGIVVNKDARPVINDNTCRGGTIGIAYLDRASGSAARNECRSNRADGFRVGGDACPKLEANLASKNGDAGISFVDRSRGSASRNVCESNRSHGMLVLDTSAPDLAGNSCSGNRGSGLSFGGASPGSAVRNELIGNSVHGILVRESARPDLRENTCRANHGVGLCYEGRSGGIARDNHLIENMLGAIVVDERASPDLPEAERDVPPPVAAEPVRVAEIFPIRPAISFGFHAFAAERAPVAEIFAEPPSLDFPPTADPMPAPKSRWFPWRVR